MAQTWIEGLSQVGLYYEGTVDSNRLEKLQTGTTYSTRTSSNID